MSLSNLCLHLQLRAFLRRSHFCLGLGVLGVASVLRGQNENPTRKWEYVAGTRDTVISAPVVGPDHSIYFAVATETQPQTGGVVALTSRGEIKWSDLPGGMFRPRKFGVEAAPTLSADGKRLYVAGSDGVLYALDADTGATKWILFTGPPDQHATGIFTTPAVAEDGTIYIGASDLIFGGQESLVWAVSPQGEKVWTTPAFSTLEASPAIGPDGTIYVGANDGQFFALEPKDGSVKWEARLNGPIFATPAVSGDGTVYVGSDAYETRAYSSQGHELWRYAASPGIGISLGADGTVYIGAIETPSRDVHLGKLYALTSGGQPKSGFPLVLNDGWIRTVPAVRADGMIVFGADNGRVYGVDPSGVIRWTINAGDAVVGSPTIDTDGTILFGTEVGRIGSFVGVASPLSEFSNWPMFGRDLRHQGRVPPPVKGGRLINLATRGLVAPGANLIAGAFIAGFGGKPLLVRAVGPTLGLFGLANPLRDPLLEFRSDAETPAINDNWGDTAPEAIRAATSNVSAFPLPERSLDAALVLVGDGGRNIRYTADVQTRDGGSGVALVEVYDADISRTNATLSNLSTRGFVGVGDNVLIPGLVVGGAGQLRVLVRAVGPTLGQSFGVPGVISHPVLVVYRKGGVRVAENSLWSINGRKGDIAGAAGLVGAFPLIEGNADSALVIALDPGEYTIQVSGEGGVQGVALVEIYALPW